MALLSDPGNILIIRFSSLGDVVMTSAVIEALSMRYPGSAISFLTKDSFAPLFDCDSRVRHVYGISSGTTVAAIRQMLGTERFDAVLDLHASLRSRLVTAALRDVSTYRVDKHALARRMMVLSRGLYRKSFDVLGSYLETIKPFGIDERILPRLVPSDESLKAIGAKVDLTRPCIGFAPGARHATKRWNEDYYACLADKMAATGVLPVFIGDDSDRDVICRVRALMKEDSLSLAGEIDIAETVALISRLKALVCNDSGPMHIAGALEIPFVAMFGPTHPDLGFAPGYPTGTILHSGASCSPCSIHGEKKCRMKSRFCMDDLSCEQVEEVLNGIIN